MADELDPVFAPLRQVTTLLTDPAALRATANRRTAMRRATVTGLSVAAVILIVAVTGLSLRHNTSAPIPPGSSQTPAPPPESSSAPVPSTPSTPSTAPSATAAGTKACAPPSFDPRPYYGIDGASGHAHHTVAVHNTGGSPCSVTESPILIGVNETSGKTEQIPMDNDSSTTLITIPAGQWGSFAIQTVGGFAGYDQTDPACANPHSYHDIVVVLNGSHFALPGYRLSWQCATAQAYGWTTTSDRPFNVETRAP